MTVSLGDKVPAQGLSPGQAIPKEDFVEASGTSRSTLMLCTEQGHFSLLVPNVTFD